MVKIYIHRLNKEFNFSNLQYLPKEQISEIKKIKHQLTQQQQICSKLLLQYALIDNGFQKNILSYLKIDRYGKPYIKNLYFNISHSNKYVVVAIDSQKIGIDVEQNNKKLINMSHSFLSKKEWNQYHTASKLTKIWTCKEAICKLLGQGIKCRLDKLDCSKYHLWQKTISNYQIAIATHNKITKPKIEFVKFQSLI